MNPLLAPTLDSSIKFYTESNNVSIIRFGPFIPIKQLSIALLRCFYPKTKKDEDTSDK